MINKKQPIWKNIPHVAASLLVMQAVILGTPALTKPQEEAESKLPYNQLLEKIETGEVTRVELDRRGKKAKVTFQGQENPVEVDLLDRNPELIESINATNVEFEINDSTDNSAAIGIGINLLLILVLILGLGMIIRRAASVSGQAFSFGKSKARFQMEATTGITFQDIAGIEEAKEELAEVVTFLKEPEKFTAIGARIPKGVLLVGPPGTGKTLLAKAIAGEAGVPFFSVSGSEFVEMFVGVGASRVRDLFHRAKESAPTLVFIDEIDAVGRQRGAGIGGGNDEREQTLNQLLTEMDGFEDNAGIIIIAATNRTDVLDSALLRPGRFDRQVMVDYPDYQAREKILEVHARNKKIAPEVSLKKIARRTPGFSGADLANLLNEAAIFTARRRKEAITISEVNDAIDRVIAGMEGTPLVDSKNKRLLAYHEIGHAIVSTLIPHHDPVEKVTLIPRGQALGLTWYTPNEEMGLTTRAQIIAQIAGILGGRAAEEVIFGWSEVTDGASDDLEKVTERARNMVTRLGMSALGPIALENMNNQVFLGNDWTNRVEYSEEIGARIDNQVRKIVFDCYGQAKKIIRENRSVIDMLVDVLIQQETIEGDDFRKLVSEYTELRKERFTLAKG